MESVEFNLRRYGMAIRIAMVACGTLLGLMAGCSQDASVPAAASGADLDGTHYLLSAEPDGAQGVIETRAIAKDQDDVVIIGRIGGSTDPFVQGRAAFSIVDESLKACSDIEGDTCSSPWDYCCETDKLPTAKALVHVVDADGKLVRAGAKKLLNLKELQTVVIRGQARRDDAGNLTVLASGLFIRR
jgi:hypothetical protein